MKQYGIEGGAVTGVAVKICARRTATVARGATAAALLTIVAITQSACAGGGRQPGAVATANVVTPPGPSGASRIEPRRLADEGLAYLKRGDAETALRLFDAAIKFDSENAGYHLLAGLAYHMQFRTAGSPETRDLAAIGYRLAARYAPTDPLPLVQLGRLYIDGHENEKARDAFAAAVEARPADLAALEGLANASYLLGDIRLALWCVREMESHGAQAPSLNRMRAVLYTAGGESERASAYGQAFTARPDAAGADVSGFKDSLSRLHQLIDSHTGAAVSGATGSASPDGGRFILAQSASPLPQFMPPPPPPTPVVVAQDGDARPPWWSCRPAGGGPPQPSLPPSIPQNAIQNGQGGEEAVSPLPALPATCVGASAPRMVVIEAVLLNTEDDISRSYGINLLQGLTGYFGYAATLVKTAGNHYMENQNAQFGLGSLQSQSSLTYALNIANSAQTRNEVIARQVLLAIDRMPSTFFSGSTVSIAVGGGAGSVSTLVDKQVGTSLSITPTFLDDDHVLLSVKAMTSDVGVPPAGSSGVDLWTTKNMVNASLVATVGQTVILSGLTQRKKVRDYSGVPVLKDIPGVQYMFSNFGPQDNYQTVAAMITIRRPDVVMAEDDAADRAHAAADRRSGGKARKYSFYWRVEAYEKELAASAPGLNSGLAALDARELYRGFKARDLDGANWATAIGLDALARQTLEALAH